MWNVEHHETWPDWDVRGRHGVGPSDEPLVIAHNAERRNHLVVLVHGLGGDPIDTWGNLPQFLFEDLGPDGVDVALYGYRSGHRRLFRTDTMSFKNVAQDLATTISTGDYQHVMLLGHSLGGLVCRQAVRQLHDVGDEQGLARIEGTMSFASPFAGSTRAAFPFRLFNSEARLLGAFSEDSTEIHPFWKAQVYEKTEAVLDPETLRETLRAKIELMVYAAWGRFDKIVSEKSATELVMSSNILGVRANHTDICKPESREADPYPWTVRHVSRVLLGPGLEVDDEKLSELIERAQTRVRTDGSIDTGAGTGGGAGGTSAGQGTSGTGSGTSGGPRIPGGVAPAPSAGFGGRSTKLIIGLLLVIALLLGGILLALSRGGNSEPAFTAEPTAVPTDVAPAPTAPPPDPTAAPPQPTATAAPEPTATAAPEPTATATPAPTSTATPEPTPTTGDTTAADAVTIRTTPAGDVAAIDMAGAGTDGELSGEDRAKLGAAVTAADDLATDAMIEITLPGVRADHPNLVALIDDELSRLTGCSIIVASLDYCGLRYVILFADEPFELPATGVEAPLLAIVGTTALAGGAMLVRFSRRNSFVVR